MISCILKGTNCWPFLLRGRRVNGSRRISWRWTALANHAGGKNVLFTIPISGRRPWMSRCCIPAIRGAGSLCRQHSFKEMKRKIETEGEHKAPCWDNTARKRMNHKGAQQVSGSAQEYAQRSMEWMNHAATQRDPDVFRPSPPPKLYSDTLHCVAFQDDTG